MSPARTLLSTAVVAGAAAYAPAAAAAAFDGFSTKEVLVLLLGQVAVGIGALWIILNAMLRQHERRIDERFAASEQSRQEATKHWEDLFAAYGRANDSLRDDIERIERELLEYKAEVAQTYVDKGAWMEHIGAMTHKLDTIRRLIGDRDQ